MIRLRSTVLLLAGLSLTACSHPAATAPADPKAALAASLAGLTAGNYRYTIAMPDVRIAGTTDLAHAAATRTTTFSDPDGEVIDEVVIGPDKYSRTSRTRRDARWEHLDLARIPEAAARHGLAVTKPDRTGATNLLSAVETATMDGSTVRGTLAVTGMIGGGIALQPVERRLEGRPAFTATLDAQGRLGRLVVDLPAGTVPPEPAGTWTLEISGYGSAPAPEPPTPTREAPEDLYETMGS
ncbi:hypothetical protein GCM10020358_11100 [Amorphoplanes nipponensis]|uniref:Lipoprotein LprG n=1 Tax=Actinoplanes nipponensis TaxID=135950 RepID=A0A919JK84_9ACTN|nr:hypothetical protein [Actinoplanes nipponensis]GIE52318.1 hypothetical protein Ani05nite_58520 [Actinoplanes nipponensis]